MSVAFKFPSRPLLLLCAITFAFQPGSPGEDIIGLQPGVKAPQIALPDQTGKPQSFNTLTGPNGLLLLFFRSADWCPFCKGQLVNLEHAQKLFAAKGINVAGVSYDSSQVLAEFSQRKSITYPLLSDTSSKLIDAFGIRNVEATGPQAGIPVPGYYLINKQGVIERRFFEDGYVNRLTANNVYQNIFGDVALPQPVRSLPSPHVELTTMQSDKEVTPGELVRLVVTIAPDRDTHVYAPGAEKDHYIVASLTLDPSNLYSVKPTVYPKPEMMHFPETNETEPVYTSKTTLDTSVAAIVNHQTLAIFAKDPSLHITGNLEYQACTSKVCFPRVKVPLNWTVRLTELDRVRAASAKVN
jgi:peroxiredoxin